jgi:hypothetical protein
MFSWFDSSHKKLALMVVAYRSTAGELGVLRRMFSWFDSSHNGEIDEEGLADALSVYAYRPDEIHELFLGIDIDGTGSVHYIEFLAATLEALGPVDEECLAEAFDRIDCDDTGFISIQNRKCCCLYSWTLKSVFPIPVSCRLFHCLLTIMILPGWSCEYDVLP